MPEIKILIPIGCRSDYTLTKPIIDKLNKLNNLKPIDVCLKPNDFLNSYKITQKAINELKTCYGLIVGDRVEMLAAATCMFLNDIKFAHVYAGVTNSIATYDDFIRHVITLWSDIQFCEDDIAKHNVIKLKNSVGLRSNAYVVGITHLEDVTPDYSKVPSEPYNLVLYNPVTYQTTYEIIESELKEIESYLDKFTVFIGPNPDKYSQFIKSNIKRLSEKYGIYYDNLPKNEFIGLLQKCNKFITNSSSGIYEAPFYLEDDQIILIGKRNKNRKRISKEVFKDVIYNKLASERIAEILWYNLQGSRYKNLK